MPVSVSLTTMKSIQVTITNSENSPADRRSEGPRHDHLNRRETLALIKELAGALERLETGA
jgi:hypothetical protein